MAHLPIPHLFLVLVLYLYLDNRATVDAYSIDSEAGQFLDYFVELTKYLGLLDGIDNLKSEINNNNKNNRTNFVKTNINRISKPLTNGHINSYQHQGNQLSIIDILNNINKKQFYKNTSEMNEAFKIKTLERKGSVENFEEIGRELIEEGRKVKTKKLLMKVLLGLKVLSIGVILPLILGIALFASWKGITISLMALLLAGIVSIKNIISGKHDTPQHVIVAPVPSHHQHWWRKTEGPEVVSWESPHELAYSGHR